MLQAAFDDAMHGRSERYREWLDVVGAAALETPTGEASGTSNGSAQAQAVAPASPPGAPTPAG